MHELAKKKEFIRVYNTGKCAARSVVYVLASLFVPQTTHASQLWQEGVQQWLQVREEALVGHLDESSAARLLLLLLRL